MNREKYAININQMTNDELLREQSSVSELAQWCVLRYAYWKGRLMACEDELVRRGVKQVN